MDILEQIKKTDPDLHEKVVKFYQKNLPESDPVRMICYLLWVAMNSDPEIDLQGFVP